MYIEIGKEIFESIPATKTPYWGSLLLAEFKQLMSFEPKEITELRNLINANNWSEAKINFSKIRKLSLNNSDKQKELYFLLAENISKITYNQTEPIGKFDSDSGFWIYQLSVKLVQLIDSKEGRNRIEGILNLFETENHSKNYFAIHTINSFKSLNEKIFNSKENDYVQLRSELPLICNLEEVKLTNPKSIMYKDSEMCTDGSFEFKFDIELKESKIGYYSLIWDAEIELIDEFYVT